ncbi:MAG: hypothetical protein ACOYOV_00405 [Bacteroidales bacterium]
MSLKDPAPKKFKTIDTFVFIDSRFGEFSTQLRCLLAAGESTHPKATQERRENTNVKKYGVRNVKETKKLKTNSICWQKQQRDSLLEEDTTAGLPLNTNAKDYILAYEPFKKEHRQFIERYEWLGTCGFGVRYCFTARYNGILGGVVLIAEPNAYQFGQELEALIQRGACASWTPKNLGSRLVMFSCKWMAQNTKKRIFTAYSDAEAGEIGTIYQACNFDFLGKEYGNTSGYLVGKKLVGQRHFTRTSSMKKWAKELDITWENDWCKANGFQDIKNIPTDIRLQLVAYAKLQMAKYKKVKREKKGKYVLLLNYGNFKHKKSWEAKSYPKR